VYRNGVLLGSADFTATSGTTVVLTNPASSGDLVETVSFYVSSVLNAIPAVANAVTDTYLNTGAVTTAKIADANVTPVKLSQPFTSGTAVSASSTSVDFTSIPSWVKRITVMFSGVSTNGTSIPIIQLGDSGGVENTSYVSQAGTVFNTNNTTRGSSFTTGFGLYGQTSDATYVFTGVLSIFNITGTTFLASGSSLESTNTSASTLSGSKTLSGTLDRVRITTVNGTDTFDAGSINILYE
jgi:hypothetical protein